MERDDWIHGRGRLPVTVLTGFLGSGKTTVLNRLLRHPGMARVMVVVNEFGEIGLDHDLVESADDDMVLLQSGCLCCTVRSDLIETLADLFARRDRGEIPAFDRIVIETTGLADPGPVLQALMAEPAVAGRLRLDGVVTTVDAVNGAATLDRHPEAQRQAAVADRLLLTKTDIAAPAAASALAARLAVLNPGAPVLRVVAGEVAPERLFEAGLYDPATGAVDARRWLDDARYATAAPGHDEGHAHGHTHDEAAARDVNRHDAHIRAVCLVEERPLPGEALDRWLKSLFLLRGPDLLRYKGILNIAGVPGPVVLHGVQHVIHPPTMLDAWPGEDRRTRMVFITYDMDEASLRASFRALTEPAS